MKMSFFFLFFLLIMQAASAQNTIKFTNDTAVHLIDKNIYGHFAEHLGKCIYGGFYIGENNKKIPNTNGIRNDVVDALKKLNSPNLRWPGGVLCRHVSLERWHRPKKQATYNCKHIVGWCNRKQKLWHPRLFRYVRTAGCRTVYGGKHWKRHRTGTDRLGTIHEL